MSDLVQYPGTGCIVEYMEGNSPQIAWVMEEQGGRLRLLLPNRRETRLNAGRLLPWAGPRTSVTSSSKEEVVQILETHRIKRESLLGTLDVHELWEMAQGEVERAPAIWFAELSSAEPDADTVAAHGRALLACKSHFKFQSPDFEVFTEEVVAKRCQEQESAKEREALHQGGAEFFRMLWDVACRKRQLPPADAREWPAAELQERLKTLLLQRIADPESHDETMLWALLSKGLPDVQHLPLQLAEAWGIVPPHYNFWLDRAEYLAGDDWAVEHAAQVDAIITRLSEQKEAECLLPFISIDSAATRDVDDAFHVAALENGTTRLTLAFACPAFYWDFGSELDKAVFRRGTSIYLPEATHHMMPERLGADVLSLLAHQIRPALCLQCDVDAAGEISNIEFRATHVRLAANLTYSDCEAVLESAEKEPVANPAASYQEQLVLGEKVALLRQQARIAAGAVIMERPDPVVRLEERDGDVQVTLEAGESAPRAQMLVAELMILASAQAALWAEEHGVAMLHRVQDVAVPKEYAGIWHEPHRMARIMRALIPSTLDVQAKPHAALGLKRYAPVTSPLRRYTDLVNVAQMVSYLEKGSARLSQEELTALLVMLSRRLDAAGQAQRFRPRYWKLLYVRQQGDKAWWEAVITEENDVLVTVSLPAEQLFVRGRRRLFGERACPGQPVRVRLGKVNPLYNEIVILEVQDA